MNLYIVTGTSKGLGRALADELAVSDKNMTIEMGRAFSGKNASNTLLEADFSSISSIEKAFADLTPIIATQHFDHAVLINNAGVVAPVARFDLLDAEAVANNIHVNLTAPIITTKLFANATRNIAKRRMVIGISSGAANRAVQGWTAYCAAKAGMEMATRVMAAEAADNDPTLIICSLAPGVVDTPMQALIRGVSPQDFPDVARFRDMKETGVLRDANAVARDIISLIHPASGESPLQNAGNYDIRNLIKTTP
jgi:benzil reductase ((S)-benzoin forming)